MALDSTGTGLLGKENDCSGYHMIAQNRTGMLRIDQKSTELLGMAQDTSGYRRIAQDSR